MSSKRVTHQQVVYKELLGEIINGTRQSNKLESVKTLADRFNVSVFTIQHVVARLEKEGLVERIHGRGTFIRERFSPLAMDDMVAVCLKFDSHFYGELCSELIPRIQSRKKAATLVDPDDDDLFKRISFSSCKHFLVNGDPHFNFELLNTRAFDNKNVIALLEWGSRFPEYHRVISDWEAGAQLRVNHLLQQGHSRILYVTSGGHKKRFSGKSLPKDDPVSSLSKDSAFLREWKKLKNKYAIIETSEFSGQPISVDDSELEAAIRSVTPTAIVGARDIDAITAYQALLRLAPKKAENMYLMGYYNTPWSHHPPTPMATVCLNLPELADHALKIVDLLEQANVDSTIVIKVAPSLIIRGNL